MKKDRSCSTFQRVLSALLCLSIVLSVVAGMDLPELLHIAENVGAEETKNEYENETLLNRWSETDYLNAARPLYASRDGDFGGVKKRTIFHVFAFEGDTICIGSSVADSKIDMNFELKGNDAGKDKGSVDVVMTDLNGVKHAIDIRYQADTDAGENPEDFVPTGFIPNPGVELAALNMEKVDGKFKGTATFTDSKKETKEYEYTPYTYTVTETGVYTFEFHSFNKGTGISTGQSYSTATYIARNNIAMPSTANEHKFDNKFATGWIAALNLTVFDESGEKQHGRTFADYLSLEMGASGLNGVRDAYYILTTDSYIYKMQFNNVSPYTYNFFANNKGLYDPATGEIIYTSVKDINNDNTYDEMGAAYKYPGTKDTDMLKSYYIFLEYPDDQLEGEMYEKPVPPDPATNLRFVSQITGDDGNKVTGAYVGEGGYFAFDVEEATTATLRLEFTAQGGVTYAPVEISGAVTPHTTNYFYWNGKDGNGITIPAKTYSIDDLAFTVTTKAGEIHFPIIDMEFAKEGITFTRMSHIYDKAGKQLDSALNESKNIYDYTRNLIYYDDTAIYYGEPAASTGYSESDMTLALSTDSDPWKALIANGKKSCYDSVNNAPKTFFQNHPGEYWTYNNMRSDGTNQGGEYQSRQSTYIGSHLDIRVGDHSHTTNVVEYFDINGKLINAPSSDQQEMISYLNSATYPVGKSTGTGITYKDNHAGITDEDKYVWSNVNNAQSTTDYAIANFWTFIPSQPAKASATLQDITIKERPTDKSFFSLTGRVFFDANTNAKFDDMTDGGDYGLSGVTLNLYKKTSDSSFIAGKTYVSYNSDGTLTSLDSSNFGSASTGNIYELVDTGKTTGDGMYKFTGLEYDPTDGTDYLYQVVKPSDNYNLKTGGQSAVALMRANGSYMQVYGYYADKSYNNSYKGTEVQHIIVGGTGVDPTKYGYDTSLAKPDGNTTVCAVDVGYNYEVMEQSLVLKKSWDTDETHPTAVAYEIKYHLQDSSADGVYKYRVISAIDAWSYEDEYLPTELSGKEVDNYYVSAEYYISTDGKTIYKHEFDYNASSGKYESFVGKVYSTTIDALEEKIKEMTKTETKVENFSNIPDLSVLSELEWKEVTDETATYRAVLDRNVGSDSSTITITNAQSHGTIEIFKYYNDAKEENALQGATFRIYKTEGDVDLAKIKALASSGNADDLKALQSYQVGSGTTRANGRIAFPGLDPNKTYVVREMYPPAGYRILNEFYEVRPYVVKTPEEIEDDNGNGIYYFGVDGVDNYVKVDVGNAPADRNFYILKQIEGRAWQDNDSFSFSITNAFDKSNAAVSSLSKADGIAIDLEDLQNFYDSDENSAIEAAEEFAKNFKTDGTVNTITIQESNLYYSYEAADKNFPDKTNTYTYPDRKMSEPLLTDGKKTAASAAEGNPTFCGVAFPFAGTYTFTITEDDFVVGTEETLTKSNRVYTVTITVKRVRNVGHEEAPDNTTENSHLEAEVSSITYKDGKDGVSQIFAGSSPLFTNTYAPAPAKQDTTYNIVKNFTGRDGDKWLEDDKFTIRVAGVDAETQNAIKNKNLVIDGFKTELDSSGATSEWVHEFNSTNNESPWEFKSFSFNNIMFPVQYVGKDGNVWEPPAGSEQTVPTKEEIDAGLEPQTVPVTYWLKITEDIPANVNGIVYDDKVYYLQIILRNAEEKVSSSTEEEDGIIDEIDMYLYHVDSSVDVKDLTKEQQVATCHTEAAVLDETEWVKSITPASDNESYAWFYVGEDGKLYSANTHDAKPTNAKLLVRRYEKHGGDANGHTMTFSNVYHTSYSWTPRVKKTLKGDGREWLDTDKFKFTISYTGPSSSGVEMPTDNTIVIDKVTTDHTKAFDAIKFSIPGEYHFTITETDNYDHTLATYNVTVTVADNNDGTLTPTIKDSDSVEIHEDYFEFVNTYESTSFELGISKEIIGRDWKEGDSFTFKITPDDNTLKAISGGIITMPTGDNIKPESDGSYTATIEYNSDEISDRTIAKSLGNVKINNTGSITEKTQYKFTISEVTTSLTEMYCREPDIDVNVTVDPKIQKEPAYNNKFDLVVTYARRVSGSTSEPTSTTDNKVTIPFENVALGTLTVGKKVVSNVGEDKTEFNFKVEFTYLDDKDQHIKVNGEEITPPASGNTLTYTFELKHNGTITFTNIPPNTSYTITETDIPKGYMLLRVRDNEEDSGGIVSLSENSVSGKINESGNGDNNNQYRLFVNGLIKELPSTGDAGIERSVFYGTMLTAGAVVLFVVLYFRRRKCSGSNA